MNPKIYFPREGDLHAQFPTYLGIEAWLHDSLHIKKPIFDMDTDRWYLPKTRFSDLTIASVDRFGAVEVWRDVEKLTTCHIECQNAAGNDCRCQCGGQFHGSTQDGNWIEIEGRLVSSTPERHRIYQLHQCKTNDGDPTLYQGHLTGRAYSTKRKDRKDWGQATDYWCASCLTSRAEVWDHCHTHGYLRAPLCTRCNTRRWRGWALKYGRPSPDKNVDLGYLKNCLDYSPKCSY